MPVKHQDSKDLSRLMLFTVNSFHSCKWNVYQEKSLLFCIKCILLCARIYLTSILLFMCMCLAFFCVFVCRTGLTWSLRCHHRRNMKMKCTYSCILPHYTMTAPVLSKFNSLNYSIMLCVVYFNYVQWKKQSVG